MTKRYLAKIVAVVVIAAGFAACGSDSNDGGGGGSGGSGGVADAGPAWGPSACGACVESACATEVGACSAEPACAQYLSCLEACPLAQNGDVLASCEADCAAPSSGVAMQAYQAFATCRGSSGCAACGSAAGDAAAKHPILSQVCTASTETNACAKCEDENCCDTYAACLNDADCQTVKNCIKACANTAPSFEECNAGCFQQTPAGVQHHVERMACINALCGEECGGPLSACEICQNQHCANSYVLCAVDPDCFLATLCIGACSSDKQCFDQCRQNLPNQAVTLLDTFASCSTNACSDKCFELGDAGP